MFGKLCHLMNRLPYMPSKSSGFKLGLIGACWFCLQPSVDMAVAAVELQAASQGQQYNERSADAPGVQGQLQPLPASDAAYTDVDVRAFAQAGSSRIVFDWPAPVGHDLRQRGNYIVVDFDRPGRMDMSSLVKGSGGLLIGAMVEENGQRVLLMTRDDLEVQVRHDDGDRLVLDLKATGDRPTITSTSHTAITPASLDRLAVDVRAGEHDGFSRVVFDWPVPVGHEVQEDGNLIVVTFDRPGQMDLSSLVSSSGGRLAAATVEDNGRRVLLTTHGKLDVQIRDYQSDLLVLDFVTTVPAPTNEANLDDDGSRKVALDDIDAGESRPGPSAAAVPETPDAREPVGGRRDVPVQPSAAVSQAGPGQFDVDEDALDRALERTLTREGVLLLPAGKIEIAPSFTYTRRESQAPTQVDLFGLFAQVRETEIRRDEFEAGISIGIGLPFDSQLEISQTYKHIDQTIMTSAGFVGLEDSDESADAFDDLVIGLAKGLVRENGWWPDIVARVRWDTGTGDDRDGSIGLGGGNHELAGSLSFVKSRDPLAFFGSASYGYAFEEDDFQPGDEVGVSLGTTLAAGPDTSLRLVLSQNFVSKAEINDANIPGSDETSASLTAGASLVLGKGVLLDTSVSAGLTDEAPDYSARVALPVRFDPF